WKPFADETARQVAAFGPDEIVLLPLYPQYSTTTTGSSVKDWAQAYKGPGRTRAVCCYPTTSGLADAHAAEIRKVWDAAGRPAHVETLVELDHEYADLARDLGVAPYLRARTPGVGQPFIADLARAVTEALPRTGVAPHGAWRCPAAHGKCPCSMRDAA